MSLITDIMEHIQDVLIDNLNPLKADIDHLHAKVEEIKYWRKKKSSIMKSYRIEIDYAED